MILEFPQKYPVGYINGMPVRKPRNRYEYQMLVKRFLTVEDYEEVLLAIMDTHYYESADSHLKNIVDSYYSYDE